MAGYVQDAKPDYLELHVDLIRRSRLTVGESIPQPLTGHSLIDKDGVTVVGTARRLNRLADSLDHWLLRSVAIQAALP